MAAALAAMLLALVPLARAWVGSSKLGGYQVTHGSHEVDPGPTVPEDDDARWPWGGDTPRS